MIIKNELLVNLAYKSIQLKNGNKLKLKTHLTNFSLFLHQNIQNLQKKDISTSVWSAKHPNAGQNVKQLYN